MQVSMWTHGHKIDIQTNTAFTPVEVVLYDGREVSRRTSWFNSKHEFDVIENGKTVQYEAAIALNMLSLSSWITVMLYRDRELVYSIS